MPKFKFLFLKLLTQVTLEFLNELLCYPQVQDLIYYQQMSDPGVVSSISAWSHTLVEIDHEIISTVILLPFAESLKKGCCQLQAKVCAQSTG